MNTRFGDVNLVHRATQAALLSTALVAAPVLVSPQLSGANTASAQSLSSRPRDPNAQLLLKADELIYNNDAQIVTALGDVQLDYGGYNVVADRVVYDQKTKRVKAFGRVEILEPKGNRIFADEIDLTDDFGNGFINALRVERPDNTRFAAESAERFDGQKTVFNHGVYTACEPCKENPDKAPVWQVKAQRVILNGKTKTVSYEKATFELFGMPIAYLPYFSHADPSVKRKSGFLTPGVGYRKELGFFYEQAYFWAVDDTKDLTVTSTAFHQQGFLTQVAWRHQLENGIYTLRAAGISQRDRSTFTNAPDTLETERGLIATTGRFDINPRWKFGWNVMAQSDRTFADTYGINGYSTQNITNNIYLRGLNDRSYFDLSAYQYLVQTPETVSTLQDEDEQAFVLPVLDYNYVKGHEASGGDLWFDFNITSIRRDAISAGDLTPTKGDVRTYGVNGDASRATIDLGWKKGFNTSSGLSITTALGVQADVTNVNGLVATGTTDVLQEGTTTRFMPKAVLEARYPLLARTENSSHVIEPIAQLLLRPDLNDTGILPNEDAQSLVFDATNLFSHNKFSGFDRIEGGTRANVGVRYSGIFDNGLALSGTFGQSFHLSGDNPYDQPDLVNAGVESGLETDRSDYVGAFGVATQSGLSFNTSARFDKDDFGVERVDAQARYATTDWTFSTGYSFIAAQPEYGTDTDRQQVNGTASVKVAEHWRVFGGATFDIENSAFVSRSAGLSYHDECFSLSLAFTQSDSRYNTTEPNRSIAFKIGLRTIGDVKETLDFDDISGLGE